MFCILFTLRQYFEVLYIRFYNVLVDVWQVLEFLKSQEQFLDRVLYHLGTSAVMDLLLRLVTSMEPIECRTSCVQVFEPFRSISACFVN